ncbi:hypothetical protein [Gimesia aquarii]|uniref:Uncharacterized protein n=1 Tax=Gimesia aquarii TaxID=2527964 RepID=A0A517WY67_9PLAN|nr:hypothetical protein [Gimesia aquarii]QDU10184.1 hypothetical protein V202x_35830 [Gimesia aquarii]
MCTGITVSRHAVPDEFIKQYNLEERFFQRSERAQKEILFMQRHRLPLLPVFYQGAVHVMRWGNRRRDIKVPLAWNCDMATLESGAWTQYAPEPIEILATFGFEKGVWYQVPEGIRGVVIHDQHNEPYVYLLLQPSSHYYQVMTGYDREPVFIGEQI